MAAHCLAASPRFAQQGYDNYTLGDATQASLREICNGSAFLAFRSALLACVDDSRFEVIKKPNRRHNKGSPQVSFYLKTCRDRRLSCCSINVRRASLPQ
jgi:hypothetical protein